MPVDRRKKRTDKEAEEIMDTIFPDIDKIKYAERMHAGCIIEIHRTTSFWIAFSSICSAIL